MPIPPPPPGGPPPPPTHSQSRPSSLSGEDLQGRGALLSDICKGTKLRRVTQMDDHSAPKLPQPQTQIPTDSPPDSKPPPAEHPYIRLYQYLQQGAPRSSITNSTGPTDRASDTQPKGGGTTAKGANGCETTSPLGSAPPIGGLFPGGASKLRATADGSSGGRSPSTRAAAPRPPSHRSTAPSPPVTPSSPINPSVKDNRDKTLPLTPPLPSKPPPSPVHRLPVSLVPPPPPYRGVNTANSAANGSNGSEPSPDLPQRQNSLNKRPAPSPTDHTPTRGPTLLHTGYTPTRGPAPPPPSPAHRLTPTSPGSAPQQQTARPPPPNRDPPKTIAPPPALLQSSPRPGCREAPPPPPCRTHGSPAPSNPPSRGKPPPPPRTPATPPPPPLAPNHRNCRIDDFESKYSFHPLDDFPPPEEYRHFTKIYPSKANRVMRGAPPLPPVAR